jgi:hypothetical protein
MVERQGSSLDERLVLHNSKNIIKIATSGENLAGSETLKRAHIQASLNGLVLVRPIVCVRAYLTTSQPI